MVNVTQAVLVIGLTGAENTEVGKERNHPFAGQCSGYCCGVVFLDAALKKIAGADVTKAFGLYRSGQVTVKDRKGRAFNRVRS